MDLLAHYERALREIASGQVDEVLALTELPRRLTRKRMMRVAEEALAASDNQQGAVRACHDLARAAARGDDGSVVIPNDAWLEWCEAVAAAEGGGSR